MGGGAWAFLVGGVICLINSDNERDTFLRSPALFTARNTRGWKPRVSSIAGLADMPPWLSSAPVLQMIHSLGAIPKLSAALQRHQGHAGVVNHAARTLGNLSMHEDALTEMVAAGVPRLMVNVLRVNIDKPELVLALLRVCDAVAARNDGYSQCKGTLLRACFPCCVSPIPFVPHPVPFVRFSPLHETCSPSAFSSLLLETSGVV